MVAVLDARFECGSDRALQAMFEARKSVFVDLLKWDLPVLDGRYELDQFDDPDARYLILLDEQDRHLASTRLLPTTRPHLLESVFSPLCQGSPPCGPETFEITRFCLDRRLRARERRAARDQLVTALVEYALAHGITRYTGVAEMGWFQQILSFGWDCAPLGMPLRYRGSLLGALQINITPDTPALLRDGGMWCPVFLLESDVPPAAAA